MELIAEASPVRQFLAYLDHIGFDEGVLNIRGLHPALRASSAPMAVSARLIVDGRYHGMQSFDQSLFALAKDGLISVRDALAAADESEDLRIDLQQAGLAAPY